MWEPHWAQSIYYIPTWTLWEEGGALAAGHRPLRHPRTCLAGCLKAWINNDLGFKINGLHRDYVGMQSTGAA